MMYFWDEDRTPPRVLANPYELSSRQAIKNGYAGMFCLNDIHRSPMLRHGKYGSIDDWEPCEFQELPVPFIHELIKKGAIVPTLRYYAGQLVDEKEGSHQLEGSYMLLNNKWYHFCHGMNQIPIEDVPPEIRLHAALINGEF